LKFIDEHILGLIILDLMLPDTDGIEICKYLRKEDKFSEIPIIILTAKSEELKSIISSLQEGLLLLDEKGKILLANESFKKAIHNNLIERNFFWEVVRDTALDELIRKTANEKRNFVEEVSLEER